MSYDIDAATEAGHTVDQQLEFLAKLHNYDIKAAEKAGFGKQEQLQYLAGLPEPKSKAENYEVSAPADEGLGIPESAVGAALGSTLGAAAGPAVGSAVDTAANVGAKMVNPQAAGAAGMPGSNSPAAVRKWLATQTSNPEAGGRTMEEAFRKSEIAAGKPIQSRGSNIPIRKGNLGISNQLPETTLPQKAAANIINAEKLGKPGVARRMAGMGVAGAELGNMIEEAKQGHYGHAALSGLGALGGAATQSRIKPIRAIGTGLSVAVPAIQKFVTPDEEEVQKKAAGGSAIKKLFAPVATKIVKASEALGPHEGKWLNVTQSDRMRSTGGDLGGPGFSKFQLERPEYAQAQAAWGVGQKPTASGIVNVNKRFPEGQAIWTPMIGSETQHHSNQHVYDALKEEFNRQARLGNLPKELQERINARLANAPATKGMFPAEFDVANPEHLAQYGDTFNRRGALSTVMSGEGVGGTKGRIIDYPGIMQEMTDPMTVGAPTHSLGTRLFSLSNEVEHRPDLHSAFPYILKGEDKGVAFAPVPKELGIQDFIQQFKEFKGREPGYYDLVRTTPSQQITEKYLRSLEAAGHKKGGLVATLKPKKKKK